MIQKIFSEKVWLGKNKIISDVQLILDGGKIIAINENYTGDKSDHLRPRGMLAPGFINAHCHLELSHLLEIIPRKTGLIGFIEKVIKLREFEEDLILAKIEEADQFMWSQGIVAVGDISNTLHSSSTKSTSKIKYYTFVEAFDLWQESKSLNYFEGYKKVFEAFDLGTTDQKKSMVPHAPYSVSPNLLEKILNDAKPNSTLSIHHLETALEDQFFLKSEGGFREFFNNMGIHPEINLGEFKGSADYLKRYFPRNLKYLLVHNTMMQKSDFETYEASGLDIYLATCAKANLYIEDQIPDYDLWREFKFPICIGTDSLASNDILSVWDEMGTIKQFYPRIEDSELIEWATINGAKALNYQDSLGTIEVGKSPGLNALPIDEKGQLDFSKNITKIA